MITITSRRDLKNQTDTYVLVKREDLVYLRVGQEYIPKRYFNTKEAREILEINEKRLYDVVFALGIQARANKKKHMKIELRHLRMMQRYLTPKQ
jgi:hypothetical protein